MPDINVSFFVQTKGKEGKSRVWPYPHAFLTPHQMGVSGYPHAPSAFAMEQELPVLTE